MNPVELSREDIQHIRELVNLNRLGNFAERTGARMALRNYLLNGADYTRMDALVDAALRGMESQGVTTSLKCSRCGRSYSEYGANCPQETCDHLWTAPTFKIVDHEARRQQCIAEGVPFDTVPPPDARTQPRGDKS